MYDLFENWITNPNLNQTKTLALFECRFSSNNKKAYLMQLFFGSDRASFKLLWLW